MRKHLVLIISGILVVILIVLVIVYQDKNLKVFTALESYNVMSLVDDKDIVTIKLYVNEKNTYFTDKKQIISAYVSDDLEDNIINLQVEDISYGSDIVEYEEEYYPYYFQFSVVLPVENSISWFIKDAYLNINYNSELHAKIKIGNFSYTKVGEYDTSNINITNLKGYVEPLSNNRYLVGMKIGFRNVSDQKITINDIKFLDNNLYLSSDCYQTTMDEQIQATYNTIKNNNIHIDLNSEEEKIYYLSLGYEQLLMINKFGLQINYQIADQKYTMYYPPYLFFINNMQKVSKSEIVIYEYNYY